MTTITTLNTSTISMTSLEIAELTNKNHADVMRDIKVMSNEISLSKTAESEYTNSRGRKYPMFNLNKDETLCLVTGYSAKLRMAVIKRVGELESALVAITQTTSLEAAHGIAEEVLARRDFLRVSYNTEVKDVLTTSFENRTSGGGRNIGQVMMNHAKLISLIVTGMTPCVFKKEHDGMNPRDFAVATNDLELIESLSRTEAKVLALSEIGMSYTEIKSRLVKD